jgi:hypothetical protein
VDSDSSTGPGGTSIAFDHEGNPHIAYHHHDSDDLRYASWTGTAWEIETVDGYGSGYSLALDPWDYPHISYSGGGGLKLASGHDALAVRWPR